MLGGDVLFASEYITVCKFSQFIAPKCKVDCVGVKIE